MCTTRFTYEHVRGTFRDFQKYLSEVGVTLQKCRTRSNKIPVNPCSRYDLRKHEKT